MDPIDKAIKSIEAHEPGELFYYSKIAIKSNVNPTTLSQRHRAVQASRATAASLRQNLSPQQEQQLIQHINKL
ncbi:hypothetical protein BU25DRAFT_310976, partial [Macroventuria anomochaeta]